MTAWHLKRSAGSRWPSSHLLEQMRLPSLFWRGSLASQTLAPENGSAWRGRPLQNGNLSAPRSPTCTPVVSAGKRALARDQAHPPIRFSVASLPSFAPRHAFRGWRTHKGFLHRTAQHLEARRQDGQHRLQIQPSSQRVAAPFPNPWFWDDGSSLLRWCPEPAARRVWSQSVRASVANEAATVRELVTSSSSEPPVQGHRLFPGLHLGGQGGRSMVGHARGRFHGSCCSTNIFELARSKGLFRPALRVQDFFGVPLPILAACYMCIKDRL
jgi:hypothetical protein